MPSSSSLNIVIIEDDPSIRRLLRTALDEAGETKVHEAETAAAGLELILSKRPDIVLLDVGLPDAPGTALVKRVREWSQVPIIIISGLDQDEVKVAALEAGADDYVTKPFSVVELRARIKVALRHATSSSATGESVYDFGELIVDLGSRDVTLKGERLKLTPIEYKLLSLLAKHSGKVVTQRQLLTEVWGPEYQEEAQYLRVYMGYLRKKIEEDPNNPRWIVTEARVGYRLAV